jgi:hypothetical protein
MLFAGISAASNPSLLLPTLTGAVVAVGAVTFASVLTYFVGRRADDYSSEIRNRLLEGSERSSGSQTELSAEVIQQPDLDEPPRVIETLPPEPESSTPVFRKEDETYKILREYSAQGLGQSRVSFNVSIGFAALGFLVLLVGVIVAIFAHTSRSSAIIPVISGGIVEAVSALFFTVNARAQKVMVEFFDKLRDDRRIEEALRLRSTITDEGIANRLQVLLALQFVTADEAPALLRQIVDPWGPSSGYSAATAARSGEASS